MKSLLASWIEYIVSRASCFLINFHVLEGVVAFVRFDFREQFSLLYFTFFLLSALAVKFGNFFFPSLLPLFLPCQDLVYRPVQKEREEGGGGEKKRLKFFMTSSPNPGTLF